MNNRQSIFSLIFALLIIATMSAIKPVYAGGALLIASNGKPVLWAKKETKGGALQSTTVNATGQVIYHVDSGTLGPLSNAEASRFVDRIFKLYTDIPTATIEYVNGGPILDPNTKQPVDITGKNAGLVLSSRNPTFQNPIIFDSDSSITGNGGVLGFFGFLNIGQPFNSTPELREGTVVLNGGSINSIGKQAFLGVFTHEFGHFAGPLDHSQIYGWIASGDRDANAPEGFDANQRYDVFAPFTETIYPFLYNGPRSSKLALAGFDTSGPFIASLSLDDNIALSNLYPTPGYLPTEAGSQVGGITGKIVIRTSNGDIPITGLNVIARRISKGKYPPSPNLQVYPGSIPLDADGEPMPPEQRDELDPLITSASFVTGFGNGTTSGGYSFIGLPPGDYMISVEGINPQALGGSGIGPRDGSSNFQLSLTVPENYNGDKENGDPGIDNPKEFTPVKVTAGVVTSGIDIILNGLGGSLTSANENEPNDAKKQGQKISTNIVVNGAVKVSDAAKVMIDFGQNQLEPVQDIYRVDLKQASALVLSLEAEDPKFDLDIFLFDKRIKNGKTPINSTFIIDVSIDTTGSELLSTPVLPAGTYYIGIAGNETASVKYKLTVLQQK